jgi:predicted nuclease of restriction endonuclease-like (RecB) superfamily
MAKKRNPSKKPLAKSSASRSEATKGKAADRRLDALHRQVREILTAARERAWQAVNTVMVDAYWDVGRAIVEDEQAGKQRASYGKRVLEGLAKRLQAEFGKGYDPSNLRNMRAFFVTYPIRDALRRELSWTHYRLLLRVDDPSARAFYEAEAVNARWATRELERQINSLLFERLALSRDKAGVIALAHKGHEITRPSDLVKDPMVLEFTGLHQDERFRESDLERALIAKLQLFLLELGKGFAFMGRQQRITLDGEHFFIDLVFYNRLTRSVVLLDLKVGRLTHQDLGQMQMYVNYYQRELTAPDENPPIGIVLCTDKSEAVVRYALPEGNTQIFASRYKLHLPTEEELAAELQRERRQIELVERLGRDTTKDGE